MSGDLVRALPLHPPARALPAGAWDCHAHVFGPFDRYPLQPSRYAPPLSPASDLLRMLDVAGFANGVIVHPSAHGYDLSVTLDAVSRAPARLHAVAVIDPATDPDRWPDLHDRGVRGLRFTQTGAPKVAGMLDLDDLARMAPAMRATGWRAEIWATADHLLPRLAQIAKLGLPVVFDHMGGMDVEAGVTAPGFARFLDQLADADDLWVKLTPTRVSKRRERHDYGDVRPFHEALCERVPDRVLYGTDWPFIAMDALAPDIGAMIDLFDRWTPNDALRHRVFVDNPRRCYRLAAS